MGEVPLHEDAVGWRNVQLGKLWEVLFCEKPLLLEQKNKNISLGKSGGKSGKAARKERGNSRPIATAATSQLSGNSRSALLDGPEWKTLP